jgi:hypothetical protein
MPCGTWASRREEAANKSKKKRKDDRMGKDLVKIDR